MRQKAGTSSEVDYCLQQGTRIIPVEIKAGKTGRLKSIQVFVQEKGYDLALRFNADMPSVVDAQTAIFGKDAKPYQLVSLPFYMIGQAWPANQRSGETTRLSHFRLESAAINNSLEVPALHGGNFSGSVSASCYYRQTR